MKLKITMSALVIEASADERYTITMDTLVIDTDEPPIAIEGHNDNQTNVESTEPKLAGLAPLLSKRETGILEKVADGLSNKEIARTLVLTESTIKVHMKAILRKLRLKNRTQAAIWVRQGGANGNGNHLGLATDHAGTEHAADHRRELQNGG